MVMLLYAPMIEVARASHALQHGRPLEALAAVADRRDAHGDAIRGIALAQLGEFDRAKRSLSRALRRFRRARESTWIVKAQAALAEIDLACRDLVAASRRLDSRPLREIGDPASAAYVDVQRARLLAMTGRHREAQAVLSSVSWGPAAVLARAELLALQGRFAEAARVRVRSTNPLLAGEADRLRRELLAPSLRFSGRPISLVELERIQKPYVDAIRKRFGDLDLSRRPAQFEILLALARGPVTAKKLYPVANESHEARLKVEISRLRRHLEIRKTRAGYVADLGILLPSTDSIEALLADGMEWPPRSIAQALGLTVRSVQRALEESPRVIAVGRGRARRYRLRKGTGIATQLLLLSARAKR